MRFLIRLTMVSFCTVLSMPLFARSQVTPDFHLFPDPVQTEVPPYQVGASGFFLLGSAVFPGDFYDALYLNGYLWIADGRQYYSGNLKTFDLSDPGNPTLVAAHDLQQSSAFRLEGDGNRLYVSAKERGIMILDATDPLNPDYLGKYPMTDTINDMDVLGNLLCVLGANDGLIILDVSDPQNIRTISQTFTAGSRYSLAVNEDSLLTIAAGSTGLLFYSIDDPRSPQYLNTIHLNQNAFHDVVCQGQLAYAVYRKTWLNSGGFAVVDLSNSPDFTILSQRSAFGVEGFPNCGLTIEGDTLFFAATQGGMGIWDVRDPQAPSRYGGYGGSQIPGNLVRWPSRVSYGGGYAYTVAPDRFIHPGRNEACVIDISDLTDPYPIGVFDPPDWVMKAVGSGDFAYVAASTDGLIIVDISSPETPFVVSNMEVFNVFFNARNLLYEDGLVYATGGNQALAVISVTDPTNPQLVGQFLDYYTTHSGIDKWGDLVAVTGFGVSPSPPGWMWTLDVSTPTTPQVMGFINLGVSTNSVDLVDTLAYIGFANGLGIINISDPYAPILISETPTGDEANDVVVGGNFAFVADRSAGLVIVDISNPYNPEQVSSLQTPGIPMDLELDGKTLYVADDAGMLAVDVSDISNPTITDFIKVNGSAQGVSFNEGLIFLCDRYGFHVLEHIRSGPWEPYD